MIANGEWALVEATQAYPQIIASMQRWERYVRDGGSIADWLAHNANREREIADLEQLWHADQPRPGYRPGYGYVGEPSQWGQFVSHPDGTIEEGR